MKTQTQKRTHTMETNKESKVLGFSLLLGTLMLLSFKFTLAGILTIVLSAIFCKMYLNDELAVQSRFINYLTTAIFVLTFFPGIFILLLIELIKLFVEKVRG